ncbi:MAG: glycosyltransferase [Candidatus Eisenbacteria bacterium]|nr:glycosyltransferase [Candidatus Eisenbacteria bacterium]
MQLRLAARGAHRGGAATHGDRSGPASLGGAVSAGTSRIRVALIGDYPIREDAIHAGGVQSVTHGLAHALARRSDIECHVVCATRDPETRIRRLADLTVHYLPRVPLPRLATCHLHDVPRIRAALRRIEPDIVHGQGQDRHGLAAVRSRRPTVITPHGVIFLETPLLVSHALDLAGRLKRAIMDGIEREVFRSARDMIIISRYLPRIYGPMLTARAHFIENPIDPAFFDLRRAPEPGRLLFAGTVVPRKRVDDLVHALGLVHRAAAQNPDRPRPTLRIVGPLVDPVAVSRVRGRIAEFSLDEHVALTGPLPQSDLLEEYRRAAALVLASREETAPQVIAQAMACGLPVISSDGGGVPQMVRDGETALLFPVGNTAAAAEQIGMLLQDDGVRGTLAARGRAAARERFHPDAVAQQTVAVYRQVLEELASSRAR